MMPAVTTPSQAFFTCSTSLPWQIPRSGGSSGATRALRPLLRTEVDTEERELRLLEKRADEWRDYRSALKPSSFVSQWTRRNR